MKKLPGYICTAVLLALAACAAPEREAGVPPTPVPADPLLSDIQARVARLTFAEPWLGAGLSLFSAESLALESRGDQDAAAAWLCATYETLLQSAAPNPQTLDSAGDPAANAAWGALWWHALRQDISDVGLRDLLYVLETRRGGAAITMTNIQAATSDVLRADMSARFLPWSVATTPGDIPAFNPCNPPAG